MAMIAHTSAIGLINLKSFILCGRVAMVESAIFP